MARCSSSTLGLAISTYLAQGTLEKPSVCISPWLGTERVGFDCCAHTHPSSCSVHSTGGIVLVSRCLLSPGDGSVFPASGPRPLPLSNDSNTAASTIASANSYQLACKPLMSTAMLLLPTVMVSSSFPQNHWPVEEVPPPPSRDPKAALGVRHHFTLILYYSPLAPP